MSYIMRLMDGAKLEITDDEFAALAGKSGLVHVPSINQVVNLSSVSRIAPAEIFSDAEDKSKQVFGILHDGSRAVRQFGRWYDLDSPVDDRGNHTISFDPMHYPEVARDLVPTIEEWGREYKLLDSFERRVKILSRIDGVQLLKTGDEEKDFVAMEKIIDGRFPEYIEITRAEDEELIFASSTIQKELKTGAKTESELALKIGDSCSRKTLKRYLRFLEQEGRIENSGGRWNIGSRWSVGEVE